MPITPFHFGPGAAIHAVAPKHISFLAFCAANVLIDIEPLYYMLTQQYPLHRFFHTYVGATCIVLATGLLFYTARGVAARLHGWAGMPWLRAALAWHGLAPHAVWLGAAACAYSHVVLDSVMHADMAPLAPFSQANALHGLVPVDLLHLFCLVAGAAGVLLVEWRAQESGR